MKLLKILAFAGATLVASAAAAHDTETAYKSRGACEAASAAMGKEESGWLLDTFPQFFDTRGEVSSFLTRAWTCDASNGQYYMTDHVEEVLASEWFLKRNH
jgi:hypothetical protein